MSKVIQVIADLSQNLKPIKEVASSRKSGVTLALGLLSMGGLLLISYLNNGLFFDRLVVISIILSCILTVKTLGER